MVTPPRSIRTRLVAVILLGLLLPLGVGLAIVATLDVRAIRVEILSQDVLLATMVAEYSTADVAFEDKKQSAKSLAALAKLKDIIYVAVYDASGHLFSFYARPDVAPASIPPAIVPRADASVAISNGHIDVVQAVVQESVRYGTVQLRATTDPLTMRTHAYLWSVLIAAFCVLAIALAFAILLERVISRPILSLADTARKVAEQGD